MAKWTCKTRRESRLAVSRSARVADFLETELPPQFWRYGFLRRGGDLTSEFTTLPKITFWRFTLQYKGCVANLLHNEFQNLIRSQSQHSKHQMRHHFGGASHTDRTTAEFVLQPRVDPFHHDPLPISLLLRPTQLRR